MITSDARSSGEHSKIEVPDLELEAVSLGPATHLLLVQSSSSGEIAYRLGSRHPQIFLLGPTFANRHFAIIDATRLVAICDPSSNRLIGIAGYPAGQVRVFLFGEHWGHWIDESGRWRATDGNPLEVMRDLRIAVEVDPGLRDVAVDFYANIYNREVYSMESRKLFKEGRLRHKVAITFAAPSGEFSRGQITLEDIQTGFRHTAYSVRDFPIRWESASSVPIPEQGRAPAPQPTRPAEPEPKPAPEPVPESPPEPSSGRARLKPRAATGATPKPAPEKPKVEPEASSSWKPRAASREKWDGRTPLKESPKAGPRPSRATLRPSPVRKPAEPSRPASIRPMARKKRDEPLPATEHMALPDLIATIDSELEQDRVWKLIENNLMLGRPERTYGLISNYADLIGSQTAEWPPPRLKLVFRNQPGGVLIRIMGRWRVNQVLSILDEVAESEKVMEWLREREIERLMRLEIKEEPKNADAARRDLNLDKNADPQMIRKVWRTLLAFMNADVGRQQERAIHRKKDEIAKYLQTARNLLIRNRPF